ncbi:hypothetical protein [Sphingomonas japonica]|uniref:Uncharacterized protein n=1 Tax=Sphingomonas japonica TaxID=511662 RepID=A0ABX0U3U6_9SPHN|nr:hypothetical protein [Sphingomonas japonica]NIJ25168.1 hypothetical protein [Sphingomonas japonica]
MDTNYLLHREQVSLMRAKRARSSEARMAHAGLARGYAGLLTARGYPHRTVAVERPGPA